MTQYEKLYTSREKLVKTVLDLEEQIRSQGGGSGTGGAVDSVNLGTHYSTIGYFHIAKRIDEEANKVIWNHRTDMAIKEFGIYNNVDAKYAEYVTQ